jgi:Thioredoxin
MINLEQFEKGLRLDQYMMGLERNKENFRANFLKATEFFAADDMAFFRKIQQKVNIVVLTDDENPDALRDVPIIGRLSVEVGSFTVKIFRRTNTDITDAIAHLNDGHVPVPAILFFDHSMALRGQFVQRLPELSEEMVRRHAAWIEAHPEIRDAHEPVEKMTPITRTRFNQVLYALAPDQRLFWGRKTVKAWRDILES